MPLQMASGKLFHSAPARTNELRGVLYTNLVLAEPLKTRAGNLLPTDTLRPGTLVYEMKEHMEQPPQHGVLASRTVDAYVRDYASVVALALDVSCTPDSDLQRRLVAGPPGPRGVMPCRFVQSTFAERAYRTPHQAEQFAHFVGQLIGLKRNSFVAAMRAIRTYGAGMQRLGDDLDAAYTLLVSSLEPLLDGFHASPPTWDEYAEDKRRDIDKALLNACDQTRQDVRQAFMDIEHVAIGRRLRLFMNNHLDPSFFRDEAVDRVAPVGRSELNRCLGYAYSLRSSYLHYSKELPKELTLALNHGETVRIARRDQKKRKTVLTFEGLCRLVRHVIMQFVVRQESVELEPCDYSRDEPGVILMQPAPQYWLHRPGNFGAGDGRVRLFAYCGQLVAGMRSTGPTPVSDMRQVLRLVRPRLASMKIQDRLPFLALHRLYDCVGSTTERKDNNSSIVPRYEEELSRPSIETMLLALFVEPMPTWSLSEHRRAHDAYFEGSGRDRGVRLDSVIEVGLTLELAERYRKSGEINEARDLIALAVENCPGNELLMRFEEHFDATVRIIWRGLMGLTTGERRNDD